MCVDPTYHKYTDKACFADAYHVLDNLRPEDRRELEVSGETAESVVLETMCNEHIVSNVFYSPSTNLPMGLFGVSEDGRIWLISTPELPKHSIRFLKDSRKWIEEFHKDHEVLWNWVDARQTVHLKWLIKWLGFHITHSGNMNGYTFYRLEHRR